MQKQKRKVKAKWLWALCVAAVVMVMILLVGALRGWFGEQKIKLDAGFYHTNKGFMDLDADGYKLLTEEQSSFVVFVDQLGCTTADRLRDYMEKYMEQNEIAVYKIMFEKMKDTALHDYVKYYPSVAIIEKGKVKTYLRADSDDDANVYNNYEDFERWMSERINKE